MLLSQKIIIFSALVTQLFFLSADWMSGQEALLEQAMSRAQVTINQHAMDAINRCLNHLEALAQARRQHQHMLLLLRNGRPPKAAAAENRNLPSVWHAGIAQRIKALGGQFVSQRPST